MSDKDKEIERFELKFNKGRLIAIVEINGEFYKKDVTEYFSNKNGHDDWLDYRLGI